MVVVEENNSVSKEEEDAFDVLPNELVALILIQHVPPIWRVLCHFVCHRWHHLLLRQAGPRPPVAVGKLFTNEAARGGHLKVLQWARNQYFPCNTREICCLAARGGHLEVLQWATSLGFPCNALLTVLTCAHAAGGGHLEVLQWLRSQGCRWNRLTCAFAAEGGHLEVLQWALSQDCLWNQRQCVQAAKDGGHLEVWQWAREQNHSAD